MTAVVRPICIDHLDLGDGGISLLARKIGAAELDVVDIHSETELLDKLCKSLVGHSDKSVNGCDRCGNIIFHLESFGLLESRLSCLNGVDYVLFDLLNVSIGKRAFKNVHLCSSDKRTVAAGDYLNTLRRRVCSLVELTGEKFNREHLAISCIKLLGNYIELRLGENALYRLGEKLLGDILRVIAVEHADTGEILDTHKCAKLGIKCLCLICKLGLLFYIYSIYHISCSPAPSLLLRRCPFCNMHFRS